MVEQGTHKPLDVSSNLTLATINRSFSRHPSRLFSGWMLWYIHINNVSRTAHYRSWVVP
jgi:hypothetical protein